MESLVGGAGVRSRSERQSNNHFAHELTSPAPVSATLYDAFQTVIDAQALPYGVPGTPSHVPTLPMENYDELYDDTPGTLRTIPGLDYSRIGRVVDVTKPFYEIPTGPALPQATLNRAFFQQALMRLRPFTHYYSNTSHQRQGNTLLVRRWCEYYDGKEQVVGSYSYAHTTCPYNATTQEPLEDGAVRVFNNCYKFVSA